MTGGHATKPFASKPSVAQPVDQLAPIARTASGTIYVLQSKSEHPLVVENRELVHKIGVTNMSVEKRIVGVQLQRQGPDPRQPNDPLPHQANGDYRQRQPKSHVPQWTPTVAPDVLPPRSPVKIYSAKGLADIGRAWKMGLTSGYCSPIQPKNYLQEIGF